MCSDPILGQYIATKSMAKYREKGIKFNHFPDVLEAIDVTFQKSYAQGVDYKTKKFDFQESTKHMVGRQKWLLGLTDAHGIFCILILVLCMI